jgi:ubiquinone/menaquinone biosynthesis C-methylase UbiE
MKEHIAKKKVARKYFDKWALDYDESVLQHLVFKTAHNMLFREIESVNSGYFKVLDVGCGTGELTYKIKAHFAEAEVHGADLSKTMIEKAEKKNHARLVSFKIGDVEDLPYDDDSFDVITCSHSFHHYPNKEKAMSEMYRVLKPNGRLMIVDGCMDVLFGRIVFKIVEWMERHVYHLAGEEFRQIYRKSGFNNIVQKRFNFVPLLLTIGVAIKNKITINEGEENGEDIERLQREQVA